MKKRNLFWLLMLTMLTKTERASCGKGLDSGGNYPPRVPRGARQTSHRQSVFKCDVCHVSSPGGTRHNVHAHNKAKRPIR